MNYFRGKDSSRWRTNVATYERVRYEGVYPGVDVVFYGRQGQLEYDFVVSAGADPAAIRLAFEGPAPLRQDEKGNLLLDVGGETLRLSRPVIYQETDGSRRSVAGDFALGSTGEVGFRIGAYDASRPLVIDPVLSYSTYLGGSAYDSATGVAVDEAGDVYVTGTTCSLDFPTPGGVYPTPQSSPTPNGTIRPDVFVTRFSRNHWPAGSELAPVYSTYLGGEAATARRGSPSTATATRTSPVKRFPSPSPPIPRSIPHPRSASSANPPAHSRSSPGATSMPSSPSWIRAARSCIRPTSAVRATTAPRHLRRFFRQCPRRRLHRTPTTYGSSTPTSPIRGNGDAFVVTLNANGSWLLFSTYLGGSGSDEATAVTVKSYVAPGLPPCCHAVTATLVAGTTYSADFPTTQDAAQNGNRGHAFVVRFAHAGGIVYATRIGGGGESFEGATGVAIDAAANAYVTGFTDSPVFPTRNAVQAGLAWGPDAFVTRLNATGTAIVYSTYLGGLNADEASGIAVDPTGNAFVTGSTTSTNFPAVRPLRGFAGDTDAFVTQLAPDGTLTYSSPVGGSGVDLGKAIALGAGNDVFIAGET